MAIFGSVSGKEVDDFAKALARELARRFPAGPEPRSRRKGTPKQMIALLESLFAKAAAFRDQHKLGVYKKARLGTAFRWELQELGYDKAFAEAVTQDLVVHISRKN